MSKNDLVMVFYLGLTEIRILNSLVYEPMTRDQSQITNFLKCNIRHFP